MTPADEAEALDLVLGALLVFRGEFAGLRRGKLYRDPWAARAEGLLIRNGRSVHPTNQAAAPPTPCAPAGKLIPFAGRGSALDYEPDAPGGSH